MKNLITMLASLLLSAGIVCAQTYPSPTFNNVQINGTLNTKVIPSGALVGTTDTQTLSNKTLANPAVSGGLSLNGATSGATSLIPSAVASGTITIPAATDQLLARNTVDTVTNKTLDTANNTFKIAGTTITATTGSGSTVALSTNPVLTTPNIGAANGTSLQLSGLTASSALATDGSKNLVSVTNTGTGNNVLATNPILVAPNLGTPSTLVLTNATGLPLSSGVTGTLSQANAPVGSVVASYTATYSTNADLTTQIPVDDTIPQNTEGTQILSVTLTPQSTTNKLRIRWNGMGSISVLDPIVWAMFSSASGNALVAGVVNPPAANFLEMINGEFEYTPGSTSSVTISIRVGPGAAVTVRMNGNTSQRYFGGAANCFLVVEEIKA